MRLQSSIRGWIKSKFCMMKLNFKENFIKEYFLTTVFFNSAQYRWKKNLAAKHFITMERSVFQSTNMSPIQIQYFIKQQLLFLFKSICGTTKREEISKVVDKRWTRKQVDIRSSFLEIRTKHHGKKNSFFAEYHRLFNTWELIHLTNSV